MKLKLTLFLTVLICITQSKEVKLGEDCTEATNTCVADSNGTPTKCCNLLTNEGLKMYIAGDPSAFSTTSKTKLCVDPN